MPKSTITSKGQTTVPREIRRALGVGPGDTLRWEVADEAIRVTVAHQAFLRRRATVVVGPGSVVDDIRRARARRGRDAE